MKLCQYRTRVAMVVSLFNITIAFALRCVVVVIMCTPAICCLRRRVCGGNGNVIVFDTTPIWLAISRDEIVIAVNDRRALV